MKKCERCGYTSNDTAAFCTNCGSSFQPSNQIVADNMKVCSACGMPMDSAVTHCTNCGYAFKPAQTQANSQSSLAGTVHVETESYAPPTTFGSSVTPLKYYSETAPGPKKESHTVFWIILIVLIVAILALSAILVYNLTSSDSNSGTSHTIVERTPNSESDNPPIEIPEQPKTEPKYEKKSEYIVCVSDNTWEQANSAANQKGGGLVCIENANEFRKICNLAEENNLIAFWVGAKRTSDDWGQSLWADGSDFDYHPWYSGEPTYYDEYDYPERYLMAFKVDGVWYFNDAVNDVSKHYSGKMGYIVEIVTEVEIEE